MLFRLTWLDSTVKIWQCVIGCYSSLQGLQQTIFRTTSVWITRLIRQESQNVAGEGPKLAEIRRKATWWEGVVAKRGKWVHEGGRTTETITLSERSTGNTLGAERKRRRRRRHFQFEKGPLFFWWRLEGYMRGYTINTREGLERGY